MPAVRRAEQDVQALLLRDLLEDRQQLLLELVLQFLLQLVDLGLRVLLEALGLLAVCRSISFSSCARAASFMTLPLVCSFCWFPWSGLALSAPSVCFFWISALTRAIAALPSADCWTMRLQIDEGDLRARPETAPAAARARAPARPAAGTARLRRRLGRRCRRGAAAGGLREHGGGAQRQHRQGERRGNGRTSHYSESFRLIGSP